MNDEDDDDETLPLNGHALHFAGDGGGVYGGGRTMLIYQGIEDSFYKLRIFSNQIIWGRQDVLTNMCKYADLTPKCKRVNKQSPIQLYI